MAVNKDQSSKRKRYSQECEFQAKEEQLHALNEDLQKVNEELSESNRLLSSKQEELQRINNDLKWSMDKFETVLRDSTIFIAYQDTSLKYKWLFNAAQEFIDMPILGKTDEEILGKSTGIDDLVNLKKKVLLEQKEIKEDMRFADRWWSLTVGPWNDENGKLKGVKTLAFDMTEQRLITERLELKRSIINTYIHSNDDYVLMVNKSNGIQVISRCFQNELSAKWDLDVTGGLGLDQLQEQDGEGMAYLNGLMHRTLYGERHKVDTSDEFSEKLFGRKAKFSVETFPLIGQDNNIVGGALVAREITKLFETHEQIKDTVKRGANLIEEDFYKDLTKQLYELFSCDYGYIGLLSSDRKSIDTIAIREHGNLAPNFSYLLPDTPCQAVKQTDSIQHFMDVSHYFPNDPKLTEWKAQTYIGVPINSPFDGKLMGVLVMITTRSLEMTDDKQYLLTILGLRAGAEMERGKATKLLRQRDEQLRRITQNTPDLIFEFERFSDGSRMFTYVSEVSQELLEVEQHQLMEDPQQFYNLIHPDDWEEFQHLQLRQTDQPEWVQWTGRIITAKTKRNKWIKLSARPAIGKNKELIWNGTISDITDEITVQEELRIAKFVAEEATHAKQDFLATMSHEIRTPLNAIYGITELLMQDEKTKGHEYLDILKFSTDNLRSLINNILDFSKLKSGKYRLLQQKIKLPLLLGHLEKAHSYMASKHENEFKLVVNTDVPEQVIGDEIVLAQVLNNLLGNAVKFTERGEILLKVERSGMKGNLVKLKFSVSDTGIGIRKDQMEKIFGKFEQTDTGYQKQGGTGLGLTITRMLLELFQSQIQVRSTEGKGTTFFFELWFERARMLTDEENLLETMDSEKIFSKNIRLLVVEDVDENRMLLIKYLSRFSHILTAEAVNGQEAVKMVSENDYDLVLMDIRMPVMGGEESMRQIRQLEGKKYQKLPIIALTADTYGVEKNSGFTDVITKPFKFKNLLQVIEKYCE